MSAYQPGYTPPQPGYMPPPPGALRGAVGPSAWWFGAAGAVAIVGIGVAIVIFVRTFVGWVDRIDDFQRVLVPGEETVTLDGTGGYSIYHEYIGAEDGFFAPEVDLTLTAPDGSDVTLRAYDTNVTYNNDGHEGVGLFTFTAEEPGDYVLSANGEQSTLAVGRGLGRGIVSGIVWGIVAGLLGVVAGIVIAIVVGVSRGRNRRRQMPGVPPGSMPPPAGYGQSPPGMYGQAPPGSFGPPPPGPFPQDQPGPYPPPPPPGATQV